MDLKSILFYREKLESQSLVRPYITAMNVQMVILQNQHSGKDTHIRQVKIFGPREYNFYQSLFILILFKEIHSRSWIP